MNKARELFTCVPRLHNCAQAVAAGYGCGDEVVAPLAMMGGGRAPGGCCGALYAALLLAPEEFHADFRRRFTAAAGTELCEEIKQRGFPCASCVEMAAKFLEDVDLP